MTGDRTALVVEWNIQYGREIEAAIAAFSDVDELRAPDLVCLQEMDRGGTERIAAALGLDYVYVAATVHPKTSRDFGNAILSARAIDRTESVKLPNESGRQVTPRVALWAATNLDAAPVEVCSVHTETPVLALRQRVEQFEAVAAGVAARSPANLLVAGDFNTAGSRSTRRLIETMRAHGLDRLSEEAGWGVTRGTRRFTLDHVFARGFTVHECGVVRGLGASDHAPLWLRVSPDLDAPSDGRP